MVSAILITRNESANIQGCLESIRWVDEVIVVDSGSTDDTLAKANKLGARVFVREWEGFGPAKNFAVSQVKNSWVLWIDADERVTPELAEEIKKVVSDDRGEFVAFDFPRKAEFLGRWILHCGWYPGRIVRLFRASAGKFTEHKVHERLEIAGSTGHLQSDLLHHTDPTLHHYFEKFNRYTSLGAEELKVQGRKFSIANLLLNPIWVFVRMYFIRRGFLDGIQGFILCVLSSCYVFTKYAKLWEYDTYINEAKP